MTKFESSVKTINSPQESVYNLLSDLTNIESFKDRMPQDLIKDLSFDEDTLTVSIAPVGKISFHIIERDPHSCIKFQASNSPVPLNLWIQLVSLDEKSCKVKITAGVEVNPFMKGMIQKPLKDGLEKMVEVIARLPY
ncbi:MAG: SRPBCC family protein [Bacteroidales bacterium]|nr:SRPBCC family protein [Bacteroidales bacterium]